MNTALILVDVINHYFHPNGAGYDPVYATILLWIKQALEAARHNGLVIIHALEGHIPAHPRDFEWKKLTPHNEMGSFDAAPAPGIAILADDYVVRKRRYSAFLFTDLDLLLRECSVHRVILIGVKTHVGIRATAQDAFGHGYEVWIVREAVGSRHAHLHAASLEDIDRYMGRIVSMHEYLSSIAGRR